MLEVPPPLPDAVKTIANCCPINIELFVRKDMPRRVWLPPGHGVPKEMEEHPLEVLSVVAVDDGVPCVMGIPNDHIETPACPLTFLECTLQEIKRAEAMLGAAELLPLEFGDVGFRQNTRECARCGG